MQTVPFQNFKYIQEAFLCAEDFFEESSFIGFEVLKKFYLDTKL
jgi:hypothetical protein